MSLQCPFNCKATFLLYDYSVALDGRDLCGSAGPGHAAAGCPAFRQEQPAGTGQLSLRPTNHQ